MENTCQKMENTCQKMENSCQKMENQICTTKNTNRKQLSILYLSSDTNRLADGKLHQISLTKGIKSKPISIYCDETEETGVNIISVPQHIPNLVKSTLVHCDDRAVCTMQDSEITVPMSIDILQKKSSCSNMDLDEKEEPIFAMDVDDQGEIADHDLAEKSNSAILSALSVRSAMYLSCRNSDRSSPGSECEIIENTAVYSCSDYANDIYSYLSEMEVIYRPKANYMDNQPEINDSMRKLLVDWLADISNFYGFAQQTLHLAVAYAERFLSSMTCPKKNYQLVGTAALIIAAKYEEIILPRIDDFVYITDDAYTKRQLLDMEQILLKSLDFNLCSPTAATFLGWYASVSHANQLCRNLAKYLCDLALMEYSFVSYLPSLVAASCTYLAYYVTNGVFEKTCDILANHKASDIQRCSEALLLLWKNARSQPYTAVRDKYKQNRYGKVAYLEPPESFLFDDL